MMKLYYVSNTDNFGDAVNKEIFADVLGVAVEPASYFAAEVFGIGSILAKAFIHTKPGNGTLRNWWRNREKYAVRRRGMAAPIHIFGSGFIRDESVNLEKYREIGVVALRGNKTRAIMEKILGRDLSSVPLGDPGLLMNRLVPPNPEKQYRLGIVPHYEDHDNPLIQRLLSENEGAIAINILGDPVQTLAKINECEVILSSAMHGLIAADSLAIPNRWLKVSDKLMGGSFKFHDYYSVFDIEPSPWDLREENDFRVKIPDLIARQRITSDKVDEVNKVLLKAFGDFQARMEANKR